MLLFTIGAALADDYVPGSDVQAQADKPVDDAVKDGWTPLLNVGFNGAMNDSRKVVGQSDGTTLTAGLLLNGAANLHHGHQDWENTLVFALAESRSPTIDSWTKTTDSLDLVSSYFLALPKVHWIGPFARAKLNTPVLPGAIVYADATDLVIDGGAPETLDAQTRRKVTGAFEPLALRQSLGAFARPVKEDELTATLTLGVGAIETFARGGLAVTDDDTTTTLELSTIPTSFQAGAEVELQATGAPSANTTYTLGVNALYPFLVTGDSELTGLDLLNLDVNGKFSVKLAKWLSVDYVLTVKRAPQIVDAWQLQNGVLLSSGFSLIKVKPPEVPPPPPCTPCAPIEPAPPGVPEAPPTPTPDAPPAPEPPPAPVP